MYVHPNYATKRQLKEAVKARRPVEVFQPGIGRNETEGWVSVEGPHFPMPHTWYAEVQLVNGLVVKVR